MKESYIYSIRYGIKVPYSSRSKKRYNLEGDFAFVMSEKISKHDFYEMIFENIFAIESIDKSYRDKATLFRCEVTIERSNFPVDYQTT
jgi:hypothetical protein